MNKQPENPCIFCYYARMKKDICGIYCTSGFATEDGSCEHFKPYRPYREQPRKAADALEAKERLKAELEQVRKEYADLQTQFDLYGGDFGITALLKERDVLLEAVRGDCTYCKHNGEWSDQSPCWHCAGYAAREFVTGNYWQWRGPQKEVRAVKSKTFSPCPYCDGRDNNCADCELQVYRALGPIDHLRELVEADTPAPVIVRAEADREYIDYICPRCRDIIDQKRKGQKWGAYRPKHHADCGQMLDWSREAGAAQGGGGDG